MDDFHKETTTDETVFIALTPNALQWAKTIVQPLRGFFDEKGGAFIFPLPAKQQEAENFKSRVREAGFQVREL